MKIVKNIRIIALYATLLAISLSACTNNQEQTKKENKQEITSKEKIETKVKVGFIINGPVSDWGYNYAHDQGRILAGKLIGNKIETSIIENVPETADAERIMEKMIRANTNVIVATSFGYQDTIVKLAKKYPNVKFIQAWGFKGGENIASYSAKMYESWYVMGIVAGKMTKTNKLGIVAAHPIPPMKWQINAYVLGARSVNPDVTASVVFINHWFDATLASEATASLIEQNADVLIGVLDNSVAVAQTSEKKGVHFIGHNADLSKFAPKTMLTGTQWLWGNLYAAVLKDILKGETLNGRHYTGGLKEKFVGVSDLSQSVPAEVRELVATTVNQIKSGELLVYQGPIKDNKGNIQVKDGEALTHDQIMGMNWLVEGIK